MQAGPGPAEIQRAFRARMAECRPDRVATLGAELQELASARSKENFSAYAVLRGSGGPPGGPRPPGPGGHDA